MAADPFQNIFEKILKKLYFFFWKHCIYYELFNNFLLQLRLEYFIAVAVAVIVILIVVLIVVAVLLIRLCKSRLGRGSSSIHSDKITSINGSMTTLQSPYTGGTVVGKLSKVSFG